MISTNDKIAIFGGSGFLGSYVARELAKSGAMIQIISRDPEKASELKTAGAAGQIVLRIGDIRNEKLIDEVIKNSTIVINLVGILFEDKSEKFTEIHTNAAARIAELAAKYNVKSLIQISALGADNDLDANYARTKLKGEEVVRKNFGRAAIIRPSILIGQEDNFINKFARMPLIPVIGQGNTKFQPVYVADVAVAIFKILNDENLQGKTYELAGPKVYSFLELMQMICKHIHKNKIMFMPLFIAKLIACISDLLNLKIISKDQLKLLKYDNIALEKKKNIYSFKDLDIKPIDIEPIIQNYLRIYV